MIKIVDMHCHILPGVDDGAKDWETAKQILQMEYDQGVRGIIFTPHYREHYFETNARELVAQYTKMLEVVKEMGLNMRLHLGCECHSHENMGEHLRGRFCLTMAQSPYVLTEFSSAHSYQKIRNQIYELINQGYRPIIAHIERYPCILENPDKIQELLDLGAEIQVNADSVLGMDGRAVKKFCKKLMKADQIDYIGSDVHDTKNRASHIGKCAKYVERKMGTDYAVRIFYENPLNIIRKRVGE